MLRLNSGKPLAPKFGHGYAVDAAVVAHPELRRHEKYCLAFQFGHGRFGIRTLDENRSSTLEP